jgi:hypothetical protein
MHTVTFNDARRRAGHGGTARCEQCASEIANARADQHQQNDRPELFAMKFIGV